MWKTFGLLAAAGALAIAAAATPAAADGDRAWRRPAARAWAIGAISANVITPDYFPYYGSGYSYNGPYYYPIPVRCWRWRQGYRYWVC